MYSFSSLTSRVNRLEFNFSTGRCTYLPHSPPGWRRMGLSLELGDALTFSTHLQGECTGVNLQDRKMYSPSPPTSRVKAPESIFGTGRCTYLLHPPPGWRRSGLSSGPGDGFARRKVRSECCSCRAASRPAVRRWTVWVSWREGWATGLGHQRTDRSHQPQIPTNTKVSPEGSFTTRDVISFSFSVKDSKLSISLAKSQFLRSPSKLWKANVFNSVYHSIQVMGSLNKVLVWGPLCTVTHLCMPPPQRPPPPPQRNVRLGPHCIGPWSVPTHPRHIHTCSLWSMDYQLEFDRNALLLHNTFAPHGTNYLRISQMVSRTRENFFNFLWTKVIWRATEGVFGLQVPSALRFKALAWPYYAHWLTSFLTRALHHLCIMILGFTSDCYTYFSSLPSVIQIRG